MPVALHDFKIAKNIKLSEIKASYLKEFGLVPNRCNGLNKF